MRKSAKTNIVVSESEQFIYKILKEFNRKLVFYTFSIHTKENERKKKLIKKEIDTNE